MADLNIAAPGMSNALAQFSKAAGRMAKMTARAEPGRGEDVVDLSAEILAMMAAKNTFAANVKAAQSMEEIRKSLIDVLG
jgi:hypothetical protein